jgi:hypothetical protein
VAGSAIVRPGGGAPGELFVASGDGITHSDLLVINKIDLAPLVAASREIMERDARRMRGERPFFFTNRKTGDGVDRIVDFHRHRARAAHFLKIRRWRDFGSRINLRERRSPPQ